MISEERVLEKWKQLDEAILLFIQNHIRNPFLTKVLVFFTSLGNGGLLEYIPCFLCLVSKKYRKQGIQATSALFIQAVVVNCFIKKIVRRPRPYDVILGFEHLGKVQMDYSFPSGHTSAAFAVAIVFLLTMPRHIGIAAVIVACVMGFSRMYIGVHYLTDVAAGALIGSVIGIMVVHVFKKYSNK